MKWIYGIGIDDCCFITEIGAEMNRDRSRKVLEVGSRQLGYAKPAEMRSKKSSIAMKYVQIICLYGEVSSPHYVTYS